MQTLTNFWCGQPPLLSVCEICANAEFLSNYPLSNRQTQPVDYSKYYPRYKIIKMKRGKSRFHFHYQSYKFSFCRRDVYIFTNPVLCTRPTLCCTTKCTSVSYSSLRICIGNEPLSLLCTTSFSQSFHATKQHLILRRQK